MNRRPWTVRRWADALAVGLLLACALAAHGYSIGLGFWLDDHNHLEMCRDNGYLGLSRGNTFDWTGRIAHVWWAREEMTWSFFRPLTVALRVTGLALFGLDPLPFHVVHLASYLATLGLFFGLVRRCGCGPVTALTAGLFFTLHPSHAFTATWLASDCSVLVGLWSIAGFWLIDASARAGHRRPGLLAGVGAAYVLALSSRENGIMLGPLLILYDVVRVGVPWPTRPGPDPGVPSGRRRLAIYAGLAALGAAYLPIRTFCLGPVPLPRSPYYHWPWDAGFSSWLPYKLLSDAVCVPLGLPSVPIAEVPWLRSHPTAAVMGALVAVGLAVLILVPLRRSRAAWGILAGTALAAAPTALAFSAPYNYYSISSGWAVLVALWARQLWPTRPRVVVAFTAALCSSYLVGTWTGAWILSSAASVEHLVMEDVQSTAPSDYAPGARLYFINLPFFAAEVGPALRLATRRTDLEVYPLTFAPEVFLPCSPVLVEREGERTLRIRKLGAGWFSGTFGDLVHLGWFGASRSDLSSGPYTPLRAAGDLPFRVDVVRADHDGVSDLRFTFDHPLDDPRAHFFLGESGGCARPIRFGSGIGVALSPPTAVRPEDPVVLTPDRALDPLTKLSNRRLRRVQIAFNRLQSLF